MDPREIERELREFLGKRFGGAVQLAGAVPAGAPQAEPDGEGADEPAAPAAAPLPDFDLKPEQLEAYLDQYVVRQDAAKGGARHEGLHALQPGQALPRAPGGEPLRGGRPHQEQHPDARADRRRQDLHRQAHRAQESASPSSRGTRRSSPRPATSAATSRTSCATSCARPRRHRLAEHGIVYIDEIEQDRLGRLGPRTGRLAHRRAARAASSRWRRPTSSCASRTTWSRRWRPRGLAAHRQAGEEDGQHAQTSSSSSAARSPGSTSIVKRRLTRAEIGFRAAEAAPAGAPPRGTCTAPPPRTSSPTASSPSSSGACPVTVVLDPLSEEDLFAILRNRTAPSSRQEGGLQGLRIDVHFEDEALRKLAPWRTGSTPARAAWPASSRRRS